MNEAIAKLYDQAIVIESTDDYVAGELDIEKFAELIVKECAKVSYEYLHEIIKEHFGVDK